MGREDWELTENLPLAVDEVVNRLPRGAPSWVFDPDKSRTGQVRHSKA